MKNTWTPKQDARLTEIWSGKESLKTFLDEFEGHSYVAVIKRASNLKLGRRENAPKGQTSIAWRLIKAELLKGSGNRFEIAERTNIHAGTVHRQIDAHRAEVHIAGWVRRHNAGVALPIYVLGQGEDAPAPPKESKTAIGRRVRERKKLARVLSGETVRTVNPFAAAAGFVAAPKGIKGRVYINMTDSLHDELEIAA